MASQDKKKKKKKRMIWAVVIALIITAIIIWTYYNCWWGGPTPVWQLNWCPDTCFSGGAQAGPGGGTSGGCGTCPSGETCDCSDVTCPISSCDDCTPPTDRSSCGMVDDYACGGYCPELYTCESLMYMIEGSYNDYPSFGCACMPVYPAEGGDDRYCGMEYGQCGGACEIGSTCQQISDTACECVPDVTPCYLASPRTCGGGCESPYESCQYDAKYESCYCQSDLV